MQGQEAGEIASQSKHGKGIQSSMDEGNTRTLSEVGLSHKQSSDYKTIANMPEGDINKAREE